MRKLYATDASVYREMPQAVALPRPRRTLANSSVRARPRHIANPEIRRGPYRGPEQPGETEVHRRENEQRDDEARARTVARNSQRATIQIRFTFMT